MPGQLLRLFDDYRSYLVRERVETERTFTDVVDTTRGSRPRRFIALLSFDEDLVTYAALATRSGRVATGQIRTRYDSVRELTPIDLSTIMSRIPAKLRRHFMESLNRDGWLPEQTWKAVLEVVGSDPENARTLQGLESQLANTPLAIAPRQLQVLREERDALGLALQVFDPQLRSVVPSLNSINTPDVPFILAMQNADLPEDLGIAHDARTFDGWLPKGEPAVGTTTFERRGHTLTVTNVNRTAIEHVLGVDLLYFQEEYHSFVFVQYKRMKRDKRGRAYYRPAGKSYHREYQRMRDWNLRVRSHDECGDFSSYRLGSDAFFFKVYANPRGVPAQDGLLRGMYFPLGYWTSLVASPEVQGPRGGVRITYENAGRYLTNTQFADLVGSGWVGSLPQNEQLINDVVAQALGARHSVTVAVARGA